MWNICRENQDEIINMRRELHKIPEIEDELPKTMKFIIERLQEYKIDFYISGNRGGIVAQVEGDSSGKVLALRADMDALPIEEENDVSYKSANPGCMHACGHDAHVAMLLYAAKVLKENEGRLCGSVRFLFQSSEETAKGAKILISEGALDNVDAIFGIHIGSILGGDLELGTVISSPGCVMASMDKFTIEVTGKGCHGSTPEKGIDPINIISHIVIGLQAIVARETAATKPVVLSFGKIEGGTVFNAIPERVVLNGTIRTTDKDERTRVIKRIQQISETTAAAFGGKAIVEIDQGTLPLINNVRMADYARGIVREIVGEKKTIEKIVAPSMGGEDFSYYLEKVPGAFLFLNSVNPFMGADVPHHNAKFQIDESVLWIGSAFFVLLANSFLKE